MEVKQLFNLGDVYITQGVKNSISTNSIQSLLARHVSGNFGDACPDSHSMNIEAIKTKERIFSVYHVGGLKVYVITDDGHSVTTVLLPTEY